MTTLEEGMAGSAPGAVDGARLSCSRVTVHYGGLMAVSDVALAVPPARIVGLVGPNGAGKTTLFGVMSGLVHPTTGTVLLDGEDVTHLPPQHRAARGLARTFQHPELFTGLTVREHLVLAYRVRHERRRVWSDLLALGSLRPAPADERAAVDELIDLLSLGPVARRPALGLPLGVARLVELGRALAASPTVMLLDEPSSGLDSNETDQFERTLRRVASERDISVLLVEHDVELVMRLCSAVHVLDFGVLIASGPPDAVRANPAVRAAYLGEEVTEEGRRRGHARRPPPDAAVAAQPAAERAAATDAPVGSGTEVTDAPAGSATRPALSVHNLSVRYGDAIALVDVSFDVPAGTALAVLGANGAGKSSLARAVSGLVPAADGSVLLDGADITSWPAHRVRRAGLVHLPEGRGVFRSLTVLDNLRMAAAVLADRVARQRAIEHAFELFPVLGTRRRQVARLLSGGEQQMLSLARALVTSPSLLVADELSLGLAPMVVDAVFEGLERARNEGATVIMIEQYVDRALAFADDCLVLQHGRLAWKGPSAAARGEVLRHYLGEAMTSVG
jgi:ABC-type branched-subunit amino acid transport system ATPase component